MLLAAHAIREAAIKIVSSLKMIYFISSNLYDCSGQRSRLQYLNSKLRTNLSVCFYYLPTYVRMHLF